MTSDGTRSSGAGLERSCACGEGRPDWLRATDSGDGVELLHAWLRTAAYRRHRHDTYAIGLTESGVQAFTYRGASHVSTPGHVVVLHPDEPHDGRAGTAAGFGYRQVYVEPALIFAAVQQIGGRGALPFVRQPVSHSPHLAAAIAAAFQDDHAPLARDDLVLRLAEGLLAADPSVPPARLHRRLDYAAITRVRAFLDAETGRVVSSVELERIAGLGRYELARQFRRVVGASPYRYSLLRRLDHARALIAQQRPLADIALETGFADQAHFTRRFSGAFGLAPGEYRALHNQAGAGIETR